METLPGALAGLLSALPRGLASADQEDIPEARSSIFLLVAPRDVSKKLSGILAARLALRGPLHVLDGGNQFDAYAIARLVRQQTSQLQPILERLFLARAFTCYQMAVLIEDACKTLESPIPPAPVLILDLLSTFYDESVQLGERRRLLDHTLAQLQRLGQRTTVIISAQNVRGGQPASVMAERSGPLLAPELLPPELLVPELLPRLEAIADRTWHFTPAVPLQAPRLF